MNDLREAAEKFSGLTLREIERLVILCSLDRHDWSRKQVCRELGIPPRTLYEKIRRFDLQRKQD